MAAAIGDRYTTSSNSKMSPTVAAVIASIWRSMAANSSTIVAPGPVTLTCRPAGGDSRATVSRTADRESRAWAVPSMPASRTIRLTARPSGLCAPAAVAGCDHRSVTA